MKAFWQPPAGVFSLVDVPKLQFAMIDGKGDPNTSEEYRHAIEWLYSVSYPLKFMPTRGDRFSRSTRHHGTDAGGRLDRILVAQGMKVVSERDGDSR